MHKVLTYVECRAVSGVFQNIDPPLPFHPASVSSPRTKGGGCTLAERWFFWKTPDIGLASYSLIPLRPLISLSKIHIYSTSVKHSVTSKFTIPWKFFSETVIFKNSSSGEADKSFHIKTSDEIYCDGCTTGLPAAWLDSSHHTGGPPLLLQVRFSHLPLTQSTYVCRVQSSVWRLPKYWPPPHPLSTQRVCPPPVPGGEGVGGQYFERCQT